ncbi:unnamed protein product [Thelazia callipaeda]|uniref:Transposase n=1 Tax=Thelazia callipaeda TaxID=103827 RepID=A0A0N5CQP3_THECL|nr:unnamed protein product [Thelazia callipaeda]
MGHVSSVKYKFAENLVISAVVTIITAIKVPNGFNQFRDEGSTDDGMPLRWYFARSPYSLAKKHMSERVVNSLLRNAWIG